jgi:hypothetical protein
VSLHCILHNDKTSCLCYYTLKTADSKDCTTRSDQLRVLWLYFSRAARVLHMEEDTLMGFLEPNFART